MDSASPSAITRRAPPSGIPSSTAPLPNSARSGQEPRCATGKLSSSTHVLLAPTPDSVSALI